MTKESIGWDPSALLSTTMSGSESSFLNPLVSFTAWREDAVYQFYDVEGSLLRNLLLIQVLHSRLCSAITWKEAQNGVLSPKSDSLSDCLRPCVPGVCSLHP